MNSPEDTCADCGEDIDDCICECCDVCGMHDSECDCWEGICSICGEDEEDCECEEEDDDLED